MTSTDATEAVHRKEDERMLRHDNGGLRTLCAFPRRNWPKLYARLVFHTSNPAAVSPGASVSMSSTASGSKSKGEAEIMADRIRTEIRAGTFVRAADKRKAAAIAPAIPESVTLAAFVPIYLERVSQVRERNKSRKIDRYMFAQIAAFILPDGSRLGDKAIGAITEDDLEAVVLDLRAKGRATSTRNQYVQLLKKRWATKKGYTDHNPTSDDSTLKRGKIAKRHRRLAPDGVDDRGRVTAPDEERRRLSVAGVRLRLIIAALETACRLGELLALTWGDVNTGGRLAAPSHSAHARARQPRADEHEPQRGEDPACRTACGDSKSRRESVGSAATPFGCG